MRVIIYFFYFLSPLVDFDCELFSPFFPLASSAPYPPYSSSHNKNFSILNCLGIPSHTGVEFEARSCVPICSLYYLRGKLQTETRYTRKRYSNFPLRFMVSGGIKIIPNDWQINFRIVLLVVCLSSPNVSSILPFHNRWLIYMRQLENFFMLLTRGRRVGGSSCQIEMTKNSTFIKTINIKWIQRYQCYHKLILFLL